MALLPRGRLRKRKKYHAKAGLGVRNGLNLPAPSLLSFLPKQPTSQNRVSTQSLTVAAPNALNETFTYFAEKGAR